MPRRMCQAVALGLIAASFAVVFSAAPARTGVGEMSVLARVTASDDGEADTPRGLEAIISRYDAGIVSARARIESLRVRQVMIEPLPDGTSRRATAELEYAVGAGMRRTVLSSEISYPAGEYTLESLIGPELGTGEYDLVLVGTEEMDGVLCHLIDVTATVRDMRHFDGSVWISVADSGLVRVAGQVADPPFPVTMITLDKSFAPRPGGVRLLSRHSGEVEANLLFGRKRGLRHIFYEDYSVVLSQDP